MTGSAWTAIVPWRSRSGTIRCASETTTPWRAICWNAAPAIRSPSPRHWAMLSGWPSCCAAIRRPQTRRSRPASGRCPRRPNAGMRRSCGCCSPPAPTPTFRRAGSARTAMRSGRRRTWVIAMSRSCCWKPTPIRTPMSNRPGTPPNRLPMARCARCYTATAGGCGCPRTFIRAMSTRSRRCSTSRRSCSMSTPPSRGSPTACRPAMKRCCACCWPVG